MPLTVASAVRFLNSRLKALPNGSVLTSDIVVDIQVLKQGLLHY